MLLIDTAVNKIKKKGEFNNYDKEKKSIFRTFLIWN